MTFKYHQITFRPQTIIKINSVAPSVLHLICAAPHACHRYRAYMWVCRMFDRPCAKNAAFDDVYISLGFVQGPETNTGAKNESTFKD